LNESESRLLGPDHSIKIISQEKLESSVDKPQTPEFAKRQGAQEVVDGGRKLRKRYEDLKRSTDNRLAEVQDLLHRVQDYETALGNFDDWLSEEEETVNLMESFVCNIEDIDAKLVQMKVYIISSYDQNYYNWFSRRLRTLLMKRQKIWSICVRQVQH